MLHKIWPDQNNRKTISTYAVIVVLCELIFVWDAQAKPNFRFEHVFQYFPRDQRSLGTLPCMVQDHNGMMWFAGEKVYRFDGDEVHSYLEQNEDRCSSFIRGMVVDHDGVLWIVTEKGLCVFNQNQDKFVPFKIVSGESPIDRGRTATVNVSPSNEICVGMASMLAIISADRSRISYHESSLKKDFSDGTKEFRDIFLNPKRWFGLVAYNLDYSVLRPPTVCSSTYEHG